MRNYWLDLENTHDKIRALAGCDMPVEFHPKEMGGVQVNNPYNFDPEKYLANLLKNESHVSFQPEKKVTTLDLIREHVAHFPSTKTPQLFVVTTLDLIREHVAVKDGCPVYQGNQGYEQFAKYDNPDDVNERIQGEAMLEADKKAKEKWEAACKERGWARDIVKRRGVW